MSCPGDKTYTSSTITASSGYVGSNSSTSNNTTMTDNNRAQYNNNLTQSNPYYSNSKCRKISNRYPTFAPAIFSLSKNTSPRHKYSVIYVNGRNFLPSVVGTTYVNFGPYTQLPIIFFNTNNLSFTIPLNVKVGQYSVVVVNVYNGNFSPQINHTYAGILNYSNAVNYTIT